MQDVSNMLTFLQNGISDALLPAVLALPKCVKNNKNDSTQPSGTVSENIIYKDCSFTECKRKL